MPAVSTSQQRFMSLVRATQEGKFKHPSAKLKHTANSMSKQDAHDFAATSHDGLPEHVKHKKTAAVLGELAAGAGKQAGSLNGSGPFPAVRESKYLMSPIGSTPGFLAGLTAHLPGFLKNIGTHTAAQPHLPAPSPVNRPGWPAGQAAPSAPNPVYRPVWPAGGLLEGLPANMLHGVKAGYAKTADQHHVPYGGPLAFQENPGEPVTWGNNAANAEIDASNHPIADALTKHLPHWLSSIGTAGSAAPASAPSTVLNQGQGIPGNKPAETLTGMQADPTIPGKGNGYTHPAFPPPAAAPVPAHTGLHDIMGEIRSHLPSNQNMLLAGGGAAALAGLAYALHRRNKDKDKEAADRKYHGDGKELYVKVNPHPYSVGRSAAESAVVSGLISALGSGALTAASGSDQVLPAAGIGGLGGALLGGGLGALGAYEVNQRLRKLHDRVNPDNLPGGFKYAADMTVAANRHKVPSSEFAMPHSAPAGSTHAEAKGKYPIPDARHARAALGFAAMHHGKDSAEYKAVVKKVNALGYGKTAADTDSSGIGRWLALHALQSQAGIDRPYRTAGAAGGLSAVAGGVTGATGNPLAGLPINLLAGPAVNRVAIGKGDAARKRLESYVDDAKERKGHFGESFFHGVRRLAPVGAVLGGLAGGLIGGGMEGYPHGLEAGMRGNRLRALLGGLAGAGLGAEAGAAVEGAAGGTANALNDTILSRLSPATEKATTGYLSNNPSVSALPLGTVVGAGLSSPAKKTKKAASAPMTNGPATGSGSGGGLGIPNTPAASLGSLAGGMSALKTPGAGARAGSGINAVPAIKPAARQPSMIV